MRLPFFKYVSFDGTDYDNHKKVELGVFNPSARFTVEEMRQAFPLSENCSEHQVAVKPDTKPLSRSNSFASLSEMAIYKQFERCNKRRSYNEWDDFEPAYAASSQQNSETQNNIFYDEEMPLSGEESLYQDQATDEAIVDTPSDFICLADVEAEEISWLWFPYIALGKLTIISGEEGLGKS
jgi:hypothetical protein